MVVIEPTPRAHPAVVIMHHPLHALNITEDQWVHLLGVIIRYPKFILSGLSKVCPKDGKDAEPNNTLVSSHPSSVSV